MSTICYYNKKFREKQALKEALNNMTAEEVYALAWKVIKEKMKDN